MTWRAVLVSALVCGALVLLAAGLTGLSLGRAVLLAPVLVVGAGAVAGLAVLWGRIAYLSLRGGGAPDVSASDLGRRRAAAERKRERDLGA